MRSESNRGPSGLQPDAATTELLTQWLESRRRAHWNGTLQVDEMLEVQARVVVIPSKFSFWRHLSITRARCIC